MTTDPERDAERSMEQADEANGEGPQADDAEQEQSNDTEQRYGHDESPA